MHYTVGLNTAKKNKIRRLRAQGLPVDEIAALANCTPNLVKRYLLSQAKKPTKQTGLQVVRDDHEKDFERMLAEEGMADVPVEVDSQEGDEHGPLPGSADWNKLSPYKKGLLTRSRNQAEVA